MKKVLSGIIVFVLAIVALAVVVSPVQATSNCPSAQELTLDMKDGECVPPVVKCGEEFLVETKVDSNYNHVKIDFSSYHKVVEINPDEGYHIVKVELKIDSSDPADYKDYTANFPGKFDPPGNWIKYAKIVVAKTCTPVCTDPAANNDQVPEEGKTVSDDSVCTYDPVATPSAPPTELPNTGFPVKEFALLVGTVGVAAGWAVKRTLKG